MKTSAYNESQLIKYILSGASVLNQKDINIMLMFLLIPFMGYSFFSLFLSILFWFDHASQQLRLGKVKASVLFLHTM